MRLWSRPSANGGGLERALQRVLHTGVAEEQHLGLQQSRGGGWGRPEAPSCPAAFPWREGSGLNAGREQKCSCPMRTAFPRLCLCSRTILLLGLNPERGRSWGPIPRRGCGMLQIRVPPWPQHPWGPSQPSAPPGPSSPSQILKSIVGVRTCSFLSFCVCDHCLSSLVCIFF